MLKFIVLLLYFLFDFPLLFSLFFSLKISNESSLDLPSFADSAFHSFDSCAAFARTGYSSGAAEELVASVGTLGLKKEPVDPYFPLDY